MCFTARKQWLLCNKTEEPNPIKDDQITVCQARSLCPVAGADPGMPIGGGANPRGEGLGGTNIQIWQIFPKTA